MLRHSVLADCKVTLHLEVYYIRTKMGKPETHKAYSIAFKLKVVEFAKSQGKHKAAKAFNVDRKRVREWSQNEDTLKTLTKSRKRSSGGGRPVRYMDIENEALTWFSKQREAGIRVTGNALKQEALRLHKERGSQSFRASQGWFRRFKKRHNITFKRTTHVSQHAAEIRDGRIDKFLRFVIRMGRLRGYDDKDIGNMDKTPVWLEMPVKSALNFFGDSEINVSSTGHEKQTDSNARGVRGRYEAFTTSASTGFEATT